MLLSLELGLRSLNRNRWRSGLTLAAISLAVALMIWLLALYEGWLAEMVRGSTTFETGQVQVHTAGYVRLPRVYESFRADAPLLGRIASVDGVSAIAPRVRAFGLIGNEQRSQVARIVGVDPGAEAAATPIRSAVISGRWLSSVPAPDALAAEVVLGHLLAQQLRVGPSDELAVFLEAADGSLGNELLEVVGVVRTANTQVDRLSAYVHLSTAQFITALDGEIHELMLRTVDMRGARNVAVAVATAIGGGAGERAAGTVETSTLVARPWEEITPGIHQLILVFRSSYWILYVLIYLIAAIGIVNAARMSALERRREFGVMLAIGMRRRRMFRTILTETGVLGLVGTVSGAAIGLLLSWYHATWGFNIGMFTDQGSFSLMGVGFSPRTYFIITPPNVAGPMVIMLLVTLFSALWPAIQAARIDPAPTIGGRS